MDKPSTQSSLPDKRAMLVNMSEELIEQVIELVPDSNDLFNLSRVGNEKLHRIATHELLKTNSRTRQSALYWACVNGDSNLFRKLLKLGADINHQYPENGPYPSSRSRDHRFALTPLTVAIAHQQIKIVELILQDDQLLIDCPASEVDHNSPPRPLRYPFHRTGLQWALATEMDQKKKVYFINLLLNRGASPDLNSWTHGHHELPLYRAACDKDLPTSIMKRMVSAIGQLRRETPSIQRKPSALYYLAYIDALQGKKFTPDEMERLKILRAGILDWGKIENWWQLSHPWRHWEFLHHAVYSRGQYVDSHHSTAHARGHVHPSNQKQLLALALTDFPGISEPDVRTGQTPLVLAVSGLIYEERGSLTSDKRRGEITEFLQMILDAGADAAKSFVQNNYSTLSDHHAVPFACGDHGEYLTTALAGLCIGVAGIEVESCYYLRFQIGKILDFLVQNGAPVNAQDHHGLTALHFASKYGSTQRLKQLVEYGADVNAVDKRGLTALHFASRLDEPLNIGDQQLDPQSKKLGSERKRAYIASVLLKNGADPTLADEQGFTPLHYACKFGFTDVVRLLLADPRVDVNAVGHDLRMPLHRLPYKAELELGEPFFFTAWRLPRLSDQNEGLYHATSRPLEKPTIARLLVDAGADVKARDSDNFLPINYARHYNHYEIRNILFASGGAEKDDDHYREEDANAYSSWDGCLGGW
ncbi:ankyrin repeat-containing domain protein [Hypoxylon sp. NC1633]|nr:ankyrin repeat-containing domain protein [Hypoxylon sp. NC1633]